MKRNLTYFLQSPCLCLREYNSNSFFKEKVVNIFKAIKKYKDLFLVAPVSYLTHCVSLREEIVV